MELYLEKKGYVKKELEKKREERIHAQIKAEANGPQVDWEMCVGVRLSSKGHRQRRDWIGTYAGVTEQQARSDGYTPG